MRPRGSRWEWLVASLIVVAAVAQLQTPSDYVYVLRNSVRILTELILAIESWLYSHLYDPVGGPQRCAEVTNGQMRATPDNFALTA